MVLTLTFGGTLWLLVGLGTFASDTALSAAKNKRHSLKWRFCNLVVCLLLGPYAPILVGGLCVLVGVLWVLLTPVRIYRNRAAARMQARLARWGMA